MKMNKIIGIIAIIAVIGLVFIGCKDDEGLVPGNLSVKNVKDLEAIPAGVRAPATISEAWSLYYAMNNFVNNNNLAEDFADVATYDKYGVTGDEYSGNLQRSYNASTGAYIYDMSTRPNSRVINLGQSKISGAVKFDNAIVGKFADYYNYVKDADDPALTAAYTPSNLVDYINKYVTGVVGDYFTAADLADETNAKGDKLGLTPFAGQAKIKGDYSSSWSSNLTRQQYWNNELAEWNATTPSNGVSPSAYNVGDKLNSSQKLKEEFEITGGFVPYWYSSGWYRIAGYYAYESQSKYSATLDVKERDFWKRSNESSSKSAYSFTVINDSNVSVVNSNLTTDKYGAKITLARSSGSNSSDRASKSESGNQDTEILVYDNAGNLIFVLDW